MSPSPMRWRKQGLVWRPEGSRAWARSHAMVPTPFMLADGTLRVFVTCLDADGRGRPGWVDLDPQDPRRVLGAAREPLLDVGDPGSFDDSGVVVTSVISTAPGRLFMYYAGFELCTRVRYRIFTGVAASRDGGLSFTRVNRVAVLDRTEEERLFRCGAFAMADGGRVRLWYAAGSEWTEVGGKAVPVYDLRHLESEDGIHFAGRGQRSMELNHAEEHGFGRPWVIRHSPRDWELFYSIRRRREGAYRLGHAVSADGVEWQRRDEDMGLEVSTDGFDSHAISYSSVIEAGGRRYCFYNGDNFGEQGFAVAVLETQDGDPGARSGLGS